MERGEAHSNKVGQKCRFFSPSFTPSLLTIGTTELCCLSFSQCTVGTRFFLLVGGECEIDILPLKVTIAVNDLVKEKNGFELLDLPLSLLALMLSF